MVADNSSDTIYLEYQVSGNWEKATRIISGNGLSPATLTISDEASYDYGSQIVNSSTDKTFTVTHSGDVAATSLSGTGLVSPFSKTYFDSLTLPT